MSEANSRSRIRKLIIWLLAGAIVLGAWFLTVDDRKPWLGKVSRSYNLHNVCITVIFMRYWCRESIADNLLVPLRNPLSVENTTLSSRIPYVSYPQGAFLPLFVQYLMAGRPPDLSGVMGYALLLQLIMAFTIFCAARLALVKVSYPDWVSLLWSLIPVFIFLLLPGSYFNYQNGFFVDISVLLPFILLAVLELARDLGWRWKYQAWITSIVIFWGAFTEWLFVFVVIFLVVKRFFFGECADRSGRIKETLKVFAPAAIAGVFYVSHLLITGTVGEAISRIVFRTSLDTSIEQSDPVTLKTLFWHFISMIRPSGFLVLLAGGMFLIAAAVWYRVLVRKGRNPSREAGALISMALFLSIPCVAHLLVFLNHALAHDFTVIKFIPFVTLGCFVILPLLLVSLLESSFKPIDGKVQRDGGWATLVTGKRLRVVVFVVVALLGLAFLIRVFPARKNVFTLAFAEDLKLEHLESAKLVGQNALWTDIFFSPDFEVPSLPPMLMVYADKRVYQVANPADVIEKLGAFKMEVKPDGYHVCLVFEGNIPNEWRTLLAGIGHKEKVEVDGISLYRIRGDEYIDAFDKAARGSE